MAINIKKYSFIFITLSLISSILIFYYYSNFHADTIHGDVFEVRGLDAYVAALVVSVSITYFAMLTWQLRSNLGSILRPTKRIVILIAVISLLIPIVNFSYMPMPFGLIYVGLIFEILKGGTGLKSIVEAIPYIVVAALPTYWVVCISQSQGALFSKIFLRTILYFFGVFAAATLISGISYV